MAESNEMNLDQDWEINVDLSGLNAPTNVDLSTVVDGYYRTTVSDMYINLDNNANRVVIKLTVADGQYVGAIFTMGLGIPKNPQDNVRYYWRGFAESCGYTPADLDSGEISLNRTAFLGKTSFVHYTPKGNGNTYDKVEPLPESVWTGRKQGSKAAAVSSTSVEVATRADNSVPAAVVEGASSADVLAKLGFGG